ncbi:hypothetical protein D3C87_2003100 [compost metagenome]
MPYNFRSVQAVLATAARRPAARMAASKTGPVHRVNKVPADKSGANSANAAARRNRQFITLDRLQNTL